MIWLLIVARTVTAISVRVIAVLPAPIGSTAISLLLLAAIVAASLLLLVLVVVTVLLQLLHDEPVILLHRPVLGEVEPDAPVRNVAAQMDCPLRPQVTHHGERLLDDQIAGHVADEPLKLARVLPDDFLRPRVVVEDQMQHLVGHEVRTLLLANRGDECGVPVQVSRFIHCRRADARRLLLTQGVDV
jgi:hypothetical protein